MTVTSAHAILAAALAILSVTCSSCESAARSKAYESNVARIQQRYGTALISEPLGYPVQVLGGVIDGKRPNSEDLDAFVELFAAEFFAYPRELVARSGLRTVVFCKDLSYNGHPLTGISDVQNHAIYFDVKSAEYEQFCRRLIHHEFYHFIDYRDDGDFAHDAEWTSLNPIGFSYGSGGQNGQADPTASVFSEEFSGFLNQYSTTAVEEDKAEIFAALMVDPIYLDFRVRKDPAIEAKVLRMKHLLHLFSRLIDDGFWEERTGQERDKKQGAKRGRALLDMPGRPN